MIKEWGWLLFSPKQGSEQSGRLSWNQKARDISNRFNLHIANIVYNKIQNNGKFDQCFLVKAIISTEVDRTHEL
jgi:hypothetical protein